MSTKSVLSLLCLVICACLTASEAVAQVSSFPASPQTIGCGPWVRRDAPPPRDYRTAAKSYISMVEDNHFTPLVENLVKPMFQYFGADIKYTLHAFPNHPRALASLMELVRRSRMDPAQEAILTVDCYFRRALLFAPDDLAPRLLYAHYLGRNKRKPEAIAQLDYVVLKASDQAFTHYNAGLIFFELGEYSRAVTQAHRAQQLGMERSGLKEQLVAAGRWQEPAAESAGQADSTPASATQR